MAKEESSNKGLTGSKGVVLRSGTITILIGLIINLIVIFMTFQKVATTVEFFTVMRNADVQLFKEMRLEDKTFYSDQIKDLKAEVRRVADKSSSDRFTGKDAEEKLTPMVINIKENAVEINELKKLVYEHQANTKIHRHK